MNYYDKVLEKLSDFVFFKDENGHYLDVSDSFLNLIDYDSKDNVIGKSDDELFPLEIAEYLKKQDELTLEKKNNHTFHAWFAHREFGMILADVLETPVFDDNNQMTGILGIMRNITEQYNSTQTIKRREAELKAVFQTIPLPMAIKDTNGRYIYFNKHHKDYYGIKDDSINQSIYERMYETDMADTETIKKLQKQDQFVFDQRTPSTIRIMSHLGDKQKYADVIKAPIMDNNGGLIGIIVITHDVTEIVKYEDIISAAKEEAEKTSKMKSEFIANVSHEIRTPMNGVLGFIQLLETTSLSDEQKDYIDEIKKSSKTMLELLNNVLDLSKAEAGRMTFERIPFNIRDLADDAASSLVSLVANKEIDITSYIDSNIHENLIGDPLKLKQVLTNLIGNAVKFTEKGEIRIMLQLIKDYENEVEVLFRVDDTGVGIKKENLESIFEVFRQGDSSTTRKYGGTGLGLAISKHIVEQLGGKINVESEYGIGSSFTFNARFQKDLDKPNPDYLQGIDLSGIKVLVYNDNPFTLKCMTNYLKEAKVQLYEVTDIQKAIDILESGAQVDVVVTTYYGNKTIMSTELIEKAKQLLKERHIPIFLNVARTQKHILDKVEGYNFQKILVRPVRKRDYYDAIYEYWGPGGAGAKDKSLTKES